jgi:hypothetical protein
MNGVRTLMNNKASIAAIIQFPEIIILAPSIITTYLMELSPS